MEEKTLAITVNEDEVADRTGEPLFTATDLPTTGKQRAQLRLIDRMKWVISTYGMLKEQPASRQVQRRQAFKEEKRRDRQLEDAIAAEVVKDNRKAKQSPPNNQEQIAA
jgi:hypothetical protein